MRKKRRKTLFLITILILIGVFAFVYFYVPPAPEANGVEVVTPTPTPPPAKLPPKQRTTSGIYIYPDDVKQGEPALIIAQEATSTSSVKSFTFDNRPLVMFIYDGQVTALLGVDLRAVSGTFPVVLTFNDGREMKENFIVGERTIVKAPFDIPEKLGGNTKESEKELISTLAQESKIVNAIPTSSHKLWTEKFRPPLNGPLVINDPYGYTRIIGNSTTMPHKGTDLKAPMGTPVYAMNRGVVGFTGNLRNYGNTVVIDHGVGLQTVYMHLSEISVPLGKMVEKGELIGLSGDTGYVLGPHLHLTVRIWDISIDPMKFLELLGEGN